MLVFVVAKKVRAGLRIWAELALRTGFAIAGAEQAAEKLVLNFSLAVLFFVWDLHVFAWFLRR